MRRSPFLVAAAVLATSLGAPAAQAEVLRAETILPPGQSGFVALTGVSNGSGSPHLYDQSPLFSAFEWKPALFNQPGETEEPRPGVTITRDSFGVPRVDADNERNMWWGAGYAVAEDRLFQLELFRNATKGTLSTIVGKGYIDDDRIVRQDYYTEAERQAQFDKVPANLKPRFEAYTEGVNARIAEVQSSPLQMPAEFPVTNTPLQPWTTSDSVAVGIFLARSIATNADPEGIELANLRIAQLGGAKALDALVPLRTPGQLTTVPAREGRFASQPGRTRKQERRGLARSLAFVKKLTLPTVEGTTAIGRPAGVEQARRSGDLAPRLSGSSMFAIRGKDGHGYLFNGPQLGFDAPEKLLELELHAPGIDLRGMTAPGVPVIGAGFNRHVSWGVTTGASDADDLYAEKLVDGEPEKYLHKGEVRTMDCRDEKIDYDSPPSDLLGVEAPEAGSETVRMCRTIHGPVEARADGWAFARRYAIWGRELETLVGLTGFETAASVQEIDKAQLGFTWNENVMAADDQGHIGFWHPGLMPLRPRAWDERLPLPGTGSAEWRGLLNRRRMPHVIDPKQGWLANWNNLPAAGWTSGDGTARKRLDGRFFRVGLLFRLVPKLAKAGASFDGMQELIKQAGTTAQQLPAARSRLRRAAKNAKGRTRTVLDTLLKWDGSYHKTDDENTVDPGVATWDVFRAQLAAIVERRHGEAATLAAGETVLDPLYGAYHHGAPYHFFDATHLESMGLRTLGPAAYRRAAFAAFGKLEERFSSVDSRRWREPRRMYEVGAVGATSAEPIPFFDRGTYEQFVELG